MERRAVSRLQGNLHEQEMPGLWRIGSGECLQEERMARKVGLDENHKLFSD